MPSPSDFFSQPGERPFTRPGPLRRVAGGFAGLAALVLLVADVIPLQRPAAHGGERLPSVYARYGDAMPIIDNRGEMAIFEGAPDEPAVDCAGILGPRTMIALVFGQSNASNTVDPGYDSSQAVFAAYGGQCQKAHDALPGASSQRGSSWSRLGDRIVASGLYDAVLFVDIARGGSSILNWGPEGDLHPLLLATLDDLRARGMSPTHVLFHQGEADCAIGLPAEAYKTVLDATIEGIRSRTGEGCDIFVSRASLFMDPGCGDRRDPRCYKACPAVIAAQTETADPARRIFSGPNTDLLVPWFDRNDGYHFTAQAADRFAAAWMPLLARSDAPAHTLQ